MSAISAMGDMSKKKESYIRNIEMVPIEETAESSESQPLIVELTGEHHDFTYLTQREVYERVITSKGYLQIRDDKDPTKFKSRSGTANFTYFFKHPDPTKKPQELVFRRTRDPIHPQVNTIEQKYQDGDIEEDDDSKRSRVNWVQSSQLNIAPKIYFYGYIRKPAEDSGLYLAVVSEGFDTDLENFYKRVYTQQNHNIPTDTLTPTDLSIQRQLTYQLNMIAKKMDVVCFDIKPLNTVVSYKPDGCHRESSLENPIVRLIDWDGDYCIKYTSHMNKNKEFQKVTTKLGRHNREVKKHITEIINNRVLEGYISNIIMANHFFVNFNRNIFANYFNSIKEEIELVKPILQEYFCSIMYGSPYDMFGSRITASIYHFFSKHYLQQRPKNQYPIEGRIDVPPFKDANRRTPDEHPKYIMCRKLFNELYKRIFVINNTQLVSEIGAPVPDSGGESKQSIGGKRSRKHKRKKRKLKKKSRKKKRKRKTRRKKIKIRRKKRKTRRKT